ncbi:MAG TPA: phosphoserine phosphatase SerB, partial [Candidatus Sulfotelmatobacter sp.]|nr:phosphoserine phosphatase SerB [Candidatus Sulfotelmatobacter sp.]
MQNVLVLIAAPHRQPLDDSMAATAIDAMRAAGARTDAMRWLAPDEAAELPFDGEPTRMRSAVERALEGWPVDVAVVPAGNRRKRLLIADMDSTIIENETLDELAAEAGVGERVAQITARSMRGEIDFTSALRERVAMIQGLGLDALERTAARVRVTPGAATLVRTMRHAGAFTALVSGGFRFFTGRIRTAVGFDWDEANDLEIHDARLTGRVVEPVVNRDGKRTALERLAAAHRIEPTDCLAVGDGANDLAMIDAAGLGVAYHAKPVVAAAADVRIEHADLTALLFVQGYTKA